jgi:hypothetical protein
MMIFKLIPNVALHLPLTAYYGITFLSLYVGKTGITSAKVKIGNEDIDFKVADAADGTLLAVNGNPDETPTYRLRSENEQLTLILPEGIPAPAAEQEILLHHFLSYEVPWKDSEVTE